MQASDKIDVSICIVNWNTKAYLRKCLQTILVRTQGVRYEVIVVDNASEDGSAEMVANEFPQCILVKSPQNLGFGRGNNEGLKYASGDYILYLNPDTELHTNAIRGMFLFLDEATEFGAVGCKLLSKDGQIQFICARAFPTAWNQFCLLTMLYKIFPRSPLFSTVEMGYWDHVAPREVPCLSGACLMVRKAIIDTLGGFDANFFMYAEDVDLCYRIRNAYWRLYYLADEEIYHHEGAGSDKRPEKHFASLMQRESNYIFFRKHHGHLKAFQFRAAVGAGSIIRILMLFILLVLPGRRDTPKLTSYTFAKYLYLMRWSLTLYKPPR